MRGPLDNFSRDDQQTVVLAPFAAFLLVAGADGSFDRKEVKTFLQLLRSVSGKPQDLTVAVVERLLEVDFGSPELLLDLMRDRSPEDLLVEAVAVLAESVSLREAESFKADIVDLATRVAEASGGILSLFGSKVSKEERDALALIEDILYSSVIRRPDSDNHDGWSQPGSPPIGESQALKPQAPDYESVKRKLKFLMVDEDHVQRFGKRFLFIERVQGMLCAIGIEEVMELPSGTHSSQTLVSLDLFQSWGRTTDEIMTQILENSFEPELRVTEIELEPNVSLKLLDGARQAAPQILMLDRYPGLMGPFGAVAAIPTRNHLFSLPIIGPDYFRYVPALHHLVERAFNDPDYKNLSRHLYLVRGARALKMDFTFSGNTLRLTVGSEPLQCELEEMAREMQQLPQ